MGLQRSILLARPVIPAGAGAVRVVRAYGEMDDPVRLLVLLATYVGSLVADSTGHVAQCLDRRATWRTRLNGLRELFSRAKNLNGHYVALLDPDALAPTSYAGWEDRTLHRMREDIRRTILTAIDDGGWLVAQPNPTKAVSEEFDQINIDPEEQPGATDPMFAFFAPDVQPVARWLVKSGRIPQERLGDIIEDTKDPGQHILRIAYDALPEGAREAARRLQVLRAPSERNGSLGPFQWADNPSAPLEIAASDANTLEKAGVLVSDDARSPNERSMMRRSRQIFAMHAEALEAALVRGLHGTISENIEFEKCSVEEKIEIHHHAAQAGDLKRARETALYFGLELRKLATQLSRLQHDFEGAANLFKELVEQFDSTDAYAWEYLGFNLALADKKAKKQAQRAPEILKAYSEAHKLDKWNPLYHGRYVGYRAELGQPVLNEVNSAMTKYAERSDVGDFVSWFVMPVLDGLFRKGRHAERKKILDDWGTLLEWSAPGVLEKHRPDSE
jgi:hypothetical protein